MFGLFRRKARKAEPTVPEVSRKSGESNATEGPLLAAAQYVGIVSATNGRNDFLILGIKDAMRCTNGEGSEGLNFLFASHQGVNGRVYFFPEFASVWVDGESSPRPQIPTSMVTNQVPGYKRDLELMLLTLPKPSDFSAHVAN